MKTTYKKNGKTRKIRITIKRNGEVLVTYPTYVSKHAARKFLYENLSSVKSMLAEIELKRNKFDYSTQIELPTAKIIITDSRRTDEETDGKSIGIIIPRNQNIYENKTQEKIEREITKTIRREAEKHLPFRTKTLAEQYGFTFGKVKITNAKTRWGSCSRANNINLNLHLMRLPETLRDYVILHELVHTEIKNHGSKFWAKLNTVTNNKAKQLDKELRKFKISFY